MAASNEIPVSHPPFRRIDVKDLLQTTNLDPEPIETSRQHFARLPLELRDHIWNDASCAAPRIFSIYPRERSTKIVTLPSIPSVLQVNRESRRSSLLRSYTPVPVWHQKKEWSICLINFASDYVFVDCNLGTFESIINSSKAANLQQRNDDQLKTWMSHENLSVYAPLPNALPMPIDAYLWIRKIERLVLGIRRFGTSTRRFPGKLFRLFPNVKEITFISARDESAVLDACPENLRLVPVMELEANVAKSAVLDMFEQRKKEFPEVELPDISFAKLEVLGGLQNSMEK